MINLFLSYCCSRLLKYMTNRFFYLAFGVSKKLIYCRSKFCDSFFARTIRATFNPRDYINEDYLSVKAKVKDVMDEESGWGYLEVAVPKTKVFNFDFNMLEWLFERFPHIFPLLRYILEL